MSSDESKRRRLYTALQAKVGLSVGEENVSDKQIRALFRLSDAQMRQWLVVMHHLLLNERNAEWSIDISKKYFLMGNKTVQGWRIIIRSDNLDKAVNHISQLVNASPNARFQVDQMPLIGRSADRNTVNSMGKGATLVGGEAGVPLIASMMRGRT